MCDTKIALSKILPVLKYLERNCDVATARTFIETNKRGVSIIVVDGILVLGSQEVKRLEAFEWGVSPIPQLSDKHEIATSRIYFKGALEND